MNTVLDNLKDSINSTGKDREEYLNEITQRSLASGQKNVQEQLNDAFLNMQNEMFRADMAVKSGIIFGKDK